MDVTLQSIRQLISTLASFSSGILSVSAVLVAMVCAAVFELAYTWVEIGIPFAFLFVVAAAIPLFNYFFEILEHRAVGERGWPVFSWETLFTMRRQLSLVLLCIVAAAIGVQALLVAAGLEFAGMAFGIMVMLVLPVMVAVLAVTRRFARSVNPLFLLRAIIRLELGYVAILFASAAWWVLATRAWSNGAYLMIFAATLSLLMLAWFTGSIVFFYRQRLGLRSPRSPEAKLAASAQERRSRLEDVLSTAWVFASRGNVSGAVAHVRVCAAEESDALDAELWLFHRMARWRYAGAALSYGRELRERLESAGREHDASKVGVVCEMLRQAAARKEGSEES